jgi:Hormone-sensitive lipase (HSL) N-terminus
LFIFAAADRKVDQWTQIFGGLSQIAGHLIELHQSKKDRNLFSVSDGYDNVLTRALEDVNARVFYGETLGFQYFPSVRPAAVVLVGWLASYHSFYNKQSMMPLRLLGFSNSVIKNYFSPQHRAEKFIKALENSTTEFCQVSASIRLEKRFC